MKLFKKYIKIKGENNQIISPRIKGNHFYDLSPVKIIGSNNRIEIAPENQFYKLELIINGSNKPIPIDLISMQKRLVDIDGHHYKLAKQLNIL